MVFFFLETVLVMEKSTQTELHHVQDTLDFIKNEEILDLRSLLPPVTNNTVLFLDITLKIGSISGIITLQIDLSQNYVQDLHLHVENLSIPYKQLALKNITVTVKSFQSRKTKMKKNMSTIQMTIALSPTSWFNNLHIPSQN